MLDRFYKIHIIKQLEKEGIIDGFINLHLLKEYLEIYCNNDFLNFKDFKRDIHNYYFKHNNSYYIFNYEDFYINGIEYKIESFCNDYNFNLL